MSIHEPSHLPISPGSLNLAGEQARWEAADMVARRGREAAPDLLRGRAAELAGSPLAREQLVAVALESIARELEAGRSEFVEDLREYQVPSPLPVLDRQAIGEEAANPSERVTAEAESLVTELVRAAGAQARTRGVAESELLGLDAALNAAFWCDRRIAADRPTRVLMLASVPLLRNEARRLARRPLWRRIFGLGGQPA